MTSNKTKQLLCILKWQALVVSSQNNNKMDAIVQCWEMFYKFGCSGKDYVEALAFVCRLKKMCKTSNNLRIERSFSACFFKITIFPISFSNAKWILISLESLMIELYLHIKIYLD